MTAEKDGVGPEPRGAADDLSLPALYRRTERQDLILDVAQAAFAEHGFRGTSIAVVAKQAGLSQAGLLHHYPSKHALLIAVLARRDERDAQGVQLFDLPGGIALMRGQVELMRHNMRQRSLQKLFLIMAVESTEPDHPARDWALQRYTWATALFADAFRRDIDAKLVRPDVDPVALANRLIAVMDGLTLQWLLDPDRVDMAAVFAAFVEDTIAAIGVETSPQ